MKPMKKKNPQSYFIVIRISTSSQISTLFLYVFKKNIFKLLIMSNLYSIDRIVRAN